MEVAQKGIAISEEGIWDNKQAIYARMEELCDMARKENELNLIEEYYECEKKRKKLMARYREFVSEKFYQMKSKNGEVDVNFKMINEVSEVALNSDKRWKDLGFIYKKISEIEKELGKEMNARDRHEAKKILDRYTSRHAVLLHTRATRENVIANEIKIDFDYTTNKTQIDENERLIKTGLNNDKNETKQIGGSKIWYLF